MQLMTITYSVVLLLLSGLSAILVINASVFSYTFTIDWTIGKWNYGEVHVGFWLSTFSFRFIKFVKLDEFIWNLRVHILY